MAHQTRIGSGARGWPLRMAGLLVGGATALPALAQAYTYDEFSIPPGFATASVAGLNNLNEAVGSVYDPTTYTRRAMIWDAQNPQAAPFDLGTPPNSGPTVMVSAYAISDAGEVLGKGAGVNPPGVPIGSGAFVWTQATGYTHLPGLDTPGAISFQQSPASINCAGNIVGSDVYWGTFETGPVGMHWNAGLGYQPAVQSPPGGINPYDFVKLQISANNDLDELAGAYWLDGFPLKPSDAFYWDAVTGYVTLSAAAAGGGSANDINNCGQVVGSVKDQLNGPPAAVLWEMGAGGAFSSTLLPELSSDPAHASVADGVNDAGQVHGKAQDPSGKWVPVLWETAGAVITITDLSAFLPAPDPTLYSSTDNIIDINNNGYMTGRRTDLVTSLGPAITTAFVLAPAAAPVVQCAPGCPGPAPTLTLQPPTLVLVNPAYHAVGLRVVNAIPGHTIHFADDTLGRYRQSFTAQCPPGPPPAPLLLGSAVANANGEASITVRFPASHAGVTSELIAVDVGACESDVQVFTHP